jgi:hypothetical protein
MQDQAACHSKLEQLVLTKLVEKSGAKLQGFDCEQRTKPFFFSGKPNKIEK